MDIIFILSKQVCLKYILPCYVFYSWYIFVSIIGTSYFVEFGRSSTRVVHFEYTMSDLNYMNIFSELTDEISYKLKICKPTTAN